MEGKANKSNYQQSSKKEATNFVDVTKKNEQNQSTVSQRAQSSDEIINYPETVAPENPLFIDDIETIECIEPPQSPSILNPLETSTPLGSPATSTILRNIDSDLSASFNINTPSPSVCPNSPLTDLNNTTCCNTEDITDAEDSESDKITEKKKRKTKKKSDLGRIRKVHKSEWIDTKRKLLKNMGMEYISRNGKQRSKKTLLPPCDNHCRLNCKVKINEDIRKRMFDKFWTLGDRVRQWELLTKWCTRHSKKRVTTEGSSKRKFTIKYQLPCTLENTDRENKVTVCKKMFLNTFAIGEGVVRTAMNKIAQGDGVVVEGDDRGRHPNHPVVKNSEMIENVCDHVKSLAPVEAHYTRKDSSKLYLDGELTMKKLFSLYQEWALDSFPDKAQTLRQYTDIVNENFNIEFLRPKKDQCDECVAYKNIAKPVNQDDQNNYDAHIRNKDKARSLKNEDKLAAINSPNTIATAAFDFQKVLVTPHAETSILYYKRKLSVFNFTVFEMGKKVGKCYMWHEAIAKKGANEVASCLYDFIKEQSERGIKSFYFYSDNCAGQNRNRIVFMMYLFAAKQFNVNITHRFLEKGHTQNENDSVHALIERCAKNKVIYTPDQWFALVRWAKETGDPYIVKEMATEDILDFKKLLRGKNWTKNYKNQKVLWTKVRDINVMTSEPDVLNYKLSFDETDYQRLFVMRSQKRRRQNLMEDELVQAYNGPLPIPHGKLEDLKYLCSHNVIPSQYHSFFNSLQSGDTIMQDSEDED